MEDAFHCFKNAMTSPPFLAFPGFKKAFVVNTDASAVALGTFLGQEKEGGKIHPIHFASRTTTAAERNYSACENEALAVVFALRKFRVYLLSSEPFVMLKDQQAPRAAFAGKDIHGRLARWLDFFAEYDFEIRCRNGKKNQAADFLSQVHRGDPAPDFIDEGDEMGMMLVQDAVEVAISQLEPTLHDAIRYLGGCALGDITGWEKARIRQRSVRYFWWTGHLYKREKKCLVVAVPWNEREKVMQLFHDELGNYNAGATMGIVSDLL